MARVPLPTRPGFHWLSLPGEQLVARQPQLSLAVIHHGKSASLKMMAVLRTPSGFDTIHLWSCCHLLIKPGC